MRFDSWDQDRGRHVQKPVLISFVGPVTDYGSSMVQWMRNRKPRYKGGVMMEVERPSSSYVVDVGVEVFLLCMVMIKCI